MTTRIFTKTYSRKRKRALPDLTDSPSSPSPEIPVFSKDIQEAKKKKRKAQQHPDKNDASSSEAGVSPNPTAKRLKKHSSFTTPHIKASNSVPLQTAPSSSSQPAMGSSATEVVHAPLSIKIDNGKQVVSGPKHIKTASLPYTELSSAQPGPSHPILFKGTRSQIQKENNLFHSRGLASPIQITPPCSSGRHPSGTKAAKQAHSSKFTRRQSADVFRAHTSPSSSFRRRPSGSHALQRKSNQNQDWLIPPAARIPPSGEESRVSLDSDIDLNKSHSFFSPQSFSTPVPPRRFTRPGTPTTPIPSSPAKKNVTSIHQEYDTVMNDATPIPGEGSIEPLVIPSHAHVLASPRDPNVASTVWKSPRIPHRIVHHPHDSIFSSFDVSASVATIQINHNLSHGEVKETQDDLHQLPPGRTDVLLVSEGNKLHDMFSVLGLTERNKEGLYQDSGIGMNCLRANLNEMEKRGTEPDAGLEQIKKSGPSARDVPGEKPKIHDGKKQETRRRQRDIPGGRPISAPSVRQRAVNLEQRIQVYTDNEPLAVEDDEDDELLLTSKGWDWDPFEARRD